MQTVNYKRAFIHAIALWIATFVSGFVVGFISASMGNPTPMALIGLTNILVVAVGVLIIQVKEKITWADFGMTIVFFGVLSLANVFLIGAAIPAIILGTIIIGVAGALGKLLGGFFSK